MYKLYSSMECVSVSVLCIISATVYKHMVEFAKEWLWWEQPPCLSMLHLEKVITWDVNATQYHYNNNTTNSTQYSRVE